MTPSPAPHAARASRRTVLAVAMAAPLGWLVWPGRDAATARAVDPSGPAEARGNILDFIPARLHAAIRNGSVGADLSSYYALAFTTHQAVLFPAGTYTHCSFAIPGGRTLATEGTATVFRQLPIARPTDSLFVVEAAGVTIESCTITGIIQHYRHQDRHNGGNSEFNHGILIHARRGRPPVHGVAIADVVGRDIRGDAVAILCDRGADLRDVRVGSVTGRNVLRNGVSIVGGRDIDIGRIDGTAFGYATFDIEPEGDYSAPVENVRVQSIRGAVVQISANTDSYARNVTIEQLDTSPAHATGSTPAYRDRTGQLFLDTSTGLRLRNVTGLSIGSHKARGHAAHAVGYFGDPPPRLVSDPRVEIGRIDYAGIGRAEATHFALIQAISVRDIVIRGGTARMSNDQQRLVLGTAGKTGTRCIVERVTTDGTIAAYVTQSRFSDIVTVAGPKRGFTFGVEDSSFVRCRVTAGFLGYGTANCTFDDLVFTPAGAASILPGQSRGNRFRRSTVAGRQILDGPLPPPR